MPYDLYWKQKVSPRRTMEDQSLFGMYKPEEWKGLIEASEFSPRTPVELNHMDQSRTLHRLDSHCSYCPDFIYPPKACREAAAGVGLCYRQRKVILVNENTDQLLDFLRLFQQFSAAQLNAERILSLFFEFFLKKHKEEHDQLEDLIGELDNDVLNDNLQNFSQRITGVRNRIRYPLQYDEQSGDVCRKLLGDENDLLAREQLHHLRICSDRMERLGRHTRTLHDYSVQVRESYQVQTDVRLNYMMHVFTIVAMILLPLTLIIDWYDMNFAGMPELYWRCGYLFVTVLSPVSIDIYVWPIYRKQIRK